MLGSAQHLQAAVRICGGEEELDRENSATSKTIRQIWLWSKN